MTRPVGSEPSAFCSHPKLTAGFKNLHYRWRLGDFPIELNSSLTDAWYHLVWYALGNVYLEQGCFEEAIAAHSNLAQRPLWSYALRGRPGPE